MKFTAIILTYNEEKNIAQCLESVSNVAEHTFVVDSGSTDRTLQIAEEFGAKVFAHPFESHAKQWNWALQNLPISTEWVLAIDADQFLTPELKDEILTLLDASEYSAFYLKRRQVFRGKWIKHGGYYPKYLLKLFRWKLANSNENDLVDHHFIVQGPAGKLRCDLVEANKNEDELTIWIAKHQRYSALQAAEEISKSDQGSVHASFWGTPDERVLWMKQIWRALPLYIRPAIYFFYRYFLRLGFLDGVEGFVFHCYQAFWYRTLVDMNIHATRASQDKTSSEIPRSEKTRLLFFNRSFYPDPAATGQLLSELCYDLAASHNFEITVIAGPVNQDVSLHSDIHVLRTWSSQFSKGNFLGRVTNYITYFLSSSLLALRVKTPDVVIAMTDPPIIGLVAYVSSRLYRAKFVYICQDVFPQVATLISGFRSRFVFSTLEWISRFLLRKADRVVAIGETMRERLIAEKNADPQKIEVIHNWADTKLITITDGNNDFAREHDLIGKFVVMHSGNIGLSQGLEVVIEAATILRDKPEIVFVIVGEGVQKEALVSQAQSNILRNVRFIPYQPKEKLTEIFGAASIFIISLKKRLSGYIVPSKLYGILAAGKAYIAAVENDTEVARVTKRFQCGLISEPENAQDLATQICVLQSDPKLICQMSINARTAAEQYFDRQVSIEKYVELLTGLNATTAKIKAVAKAI